MTSQLSQAQLAQVLGSGCFVKRNARDNSLFISDAPRRLSPANLVQAEDALLHAGFTVHAGRDKLWLIDWTLERWHGWMARYAEVPPSTLPTQEARLEVYALERLLRAHPTAVEAQPLWMLRAMLKRVDRPGALAAVAPQLLKHCAQRLRLHQPLPSGGAGLLAAWLQACGEEDER